MTFEDFKTLLSQPKAPTHLNDELLSLWYDGNNNWEQSHDIAQDITEQSGSRIHAYLHRKEGDESNAMYWYHRCNESFYNGTLDEEWIMLVKRFL